ncbi:MAG: SdiA-regulated domain-containing protein [Roseobacter sp.]|nr:SdiA-regulated domain-containing protein [Roseobacter sp.]
MFFTTLFLGLWNNALWADGGVMRPSASENIHDKAQEFTEPSGLVLAADRETRYAVSDNVNAIFTLDGQGKVLSRLDLDVTAEDLEAIAIAPNGRVLVLKEGLGEILEIDPESGTQVSRVKLDKIPGYEDIARYLARTPENNGFEGMAVHPVSGAVFILNEAQPRLLLEISPDFSAIPRAWLLGADIGFVSPEADDEDLDVSGLTIDPRTGHFLIVSDTGKSLFELDLETFEVQRFTLARSADDDTKALRNAEGIALDAQAGRLFILTDDGKSSRFMTYEFER